MKKVAVFSMLLAVLAGCSINQAGQNTDTSVVVELQPSTDVAVNAALPLYSEEDLQVMGFVAGDNLISAAQVYSYGQGPLFDNRGVRGLVYTFSVHMSPNDTNKVFRVVYGFSPESISTVLDCTNVYSSFYGRIRIPADAPSRLYWKVIDEAGTVYLNNGQPWNAFIFDRIVSYSYADSFYYGENDGIWVNYAGPLTGQGVQLHFGWNNWQNVSDVDMQVVSNTSYSYSTYYATVKVVLPDNARYLDFALVRNGQWDNNNGQDYHTSVNPLVTIQPNNTYVDYQGKIIKSVSVSFANGNIGDDIWAHYGVDGWKNVGESKLSTYRYNGYVSPVYSTSVSVDPNASVFDVAFHNDDNQWDNNYGMDWHADITWR